MDDDIPSFYVENIRICHCCDSAMYLFIYVCVYRAYTDCADVPMPKERKDVKRDAGILLRKEETLDNFSHNSR